MKHLITQTTARLSSKQQFNQIYTQLQQVGFHKDEIYLQEHKSYPTHFPSSCPPHFMPVNNHNNHMMLAAGGGLSLIFIINMLLLHGSFTVLLPQIITLDIILILFGCSIFHNYHSSVVAKAEHRHYYIVNITTRSSIKVQHALRILRRSQAQRIECIIG
ncbi:MAG: hypothetical protein Tsb005_11790 [Gammaproteobacteria bacterium]